MKNNKKISIEEQVRRAISEPKLAAVRDPSKSSEELYPDLFALAQEVVRETGKSINKQAQKARTEQMAPDMPYKAQAILEMVIRLLEKMV